MSLKYEPASEPLHISEIQATLKVRVVRRESDKAKEIRTSSHAYMKEMQDKEAWLQVPLPTFLL